MSLTVTEGFSNPVPDILVNITRQISPGDFRDKSLKHFLNVAVVCRAWNTATVGNPNFWFYLMEDKCHYLVEGHTGSYKDAFKFLYPLTKCAAGGEVREETVVLSKERHEELKKGGKHLVFKPDYEYWEPKKLDEKQLAELKEKVGEDAIEECEDGMIKVPRTLRNLKILNAEIGYIADIVLEQQNNPLGGPKLYIVGEAGYYNQPYIEQEKEELAPIHIVLDARSEELRRTGTCVEKTNEVWTRTGTTVTVNGAERPVALGAPRAGGVDVIHHGFDGANVHCGALPGIPAEVKRP